MAYENFIASVEAKKMLEERDKYLVFADHCTRAYEGTIKNQGDSVIIKGLGSPTVWTLQKNGTYVANGLAAGSVAGSGKDVIQKGIPDAEEIKNYEVKLPVNQLATWNFKVGDIDEQLSSKKGMIELYRTKVAKKLAYEQDRWCAKTITSFADSEIETETGNYTLGTGIYLTSCDTGSRTIGGSSVTAVNILDYVDLVLEQMRRSDVRDTESVFGEVSPKFIRYLKKALRSVDTNNSKIVKGKECTPYNGVNFFMTNNSFVDVSGTSTEFSVIRTGDSVAFFDPLTHYEPYRPEKGFADAVKGFALYDCGVVDKTACKWGKVLGYAD